MFQNEYRQQNKNSYFIADFNIADGYKSKTTNKKNTLTHLFTKFDSNLDLENFIESTLKIFINYRFK